MLQHRLITGPLLIVLLLAIVVVDDALDAVQLTGFWQEMFLGRDDPPRGMLLFIVSLAIAPLAAYELARIVTAQGIQCRTWLMALAAVVGLVLSYSIPMSTPAITAIAIVSTSMIAIFALSLFIYSRHRNVEGIIAAAGSVMLAMVYLGLMLGFLLALRREHSAWWIVGVILTTKSCDIGAFFIGTAIGRHKLVPWLSPGKTWEGLAGGIASSVLVGVLLAWLSTLLLTPGDHVPLLVGAAAGALFAVVGQLGDLTMSMLKRGAGVKDSSGLLPGMGGVLDVLDSPLMVAPVAYWLLTVAV